MEGDLEGWERRETQREREVRESEGDIDRMEGGGGGKETVSGKDRERKEGQGRGKKEGRQGWYHFLSVSAINDYIADHKLIVFRLKISTLSFADAGSYMCIGANPFGETSVTGALTVLPSKLHS